MLSGVQEVKGEAKELLKTNSKIWRDRKWEERVRLPIIFGLQETEGRNNEEIICIS